MQLSYSQNMTKAVAGARYGIGPVVIDSLNAEGAVGIGFGVIAGTDPENQAKVPAATFSAGFKGIALLDAAKEQDSSGSVAYADKDMIPVLRKGRAFVPIASGFAIVAETAAYLQFAGDDKGKWTNAAGAAAVAGARSYTITTNFVADDKITIGGVEFTAKASGATGAQFDVAGTSALTAASLQAVLAANATVNAIYTPTVSGAVITLTETTPGGGNTPAAAVVTGTGKVTSGAATTSTAVDAVAVTGAKFVTSNTSTTGGVVAVELA